MASIKCGNCSETHDNVAEVRACYIKTPDFFSADPKAKAALKSQSSLVAELAEESHLDRCAHVNAPSELPHGTAYCGAYVEYTANGEAVHVSRRIDADHAALGESLQTFARRLSGKQVDAKPKTQLRQEPVQEGFYCKDGQYFKVQKAVHGSGKPYAKVLEVREIGTGADGNPVNKGYWTYAPGSIKQLRNEHQLTEEQAEEFGDLYGVCCMCGKTLTKEKSIARGMGDTCAGKQGW